MNDIAPLRLTALTALHRLAPSFALDELRELTVQHGPARQALKHVDRCWRCGAPEAFGVCRQGRRLARAMLGVRGAIDTCAAWLPARGAWVPCSRPAVTRRKGQPACRRHAQARMMLIRPPVSLSPRRPRTPRS